MADCGLCRRGLGGRSYSSEDDNDEEKVVAVEAVVAADPGRLAAEGGGGRRACCSENWMAADAERGRRREPLAPAATPVVPEPNPRPCRPWEFAVLPLRFVAVLRVWPALRPPADGLPAEADQGRFRRFVDADRGLRRVDGCCCCCCCNCCSATCCRRLWPFTAAADHGVAIAGPAAALLGPPHDDDPERLWSSEVAPPPPPPPPSLLPSLAPRAHGEAEEGRRCFWPPPLELRIVRATWMPDMAWGSGEPGVRLAAEYCQYTVARHIWFLKLDNYHGRRLRDAGFWQSAGRSCGGDRCDSSSSSSSSSSS